MEKLTLKYGLATYPIEALESEALRNSRLAFTELARTCFPVVRSQHESAGIAGTIRRIFAFCLPCYLRLEKRARLVAESSIISPLSVTHILLTTILIPGTRSHIHSLSYHITRYSRRSYKSLAPQRSRNCSGPRAVCVSESSCRQLNA